MDNNLETAKKFALEQIAPYYHNPSLCGYEAGSCKYLTDDGKMCVAGKNMINPAKFINHESITTLLRYNTEEILKVESRDKLSLDQWQYLQAIHDTIALTLDVKELEKTIQKLGLFTIEELKNYYKTRPSIGYAMPSGTVPVNVHQEHTDEDDGKQFVDKYGRTYTYVKGTGLIY